MLFLRELFKTNAKFEIIIYLNPKNIVLNYFQTNLILVRNFANNPLNSINNSLEMGKNWIENSIEFEFFYLWTQLSPKAILHSTVFKWFLDRTGLSSNGLWWVVFSKYFFRSTGTDQRWPRYPTSGGVPEIFFREV